MKSPISCIRFLLSANAMFCLYAHGQSPSDIRGYAPVSVSSANFRDTPADKLREAVNNRSVINPPPLALSPLRAPVHFVFMPGEIFEVDINYEEVCEMLSPSLAVKGYVNAADKVGIIQEPEKVTLVLRVNFGTRLWRLPTVRTESLTWRDGLVPRPRGRTLTTLGGSVVFDQRAGGNDDALAAAAANDANASSVWSGSSSQAPIGPAMNSVAATQVGYESTRDFNIIVVDAFDYKELKQKGKGAQRLWTTFVASPREPNKPFSAVAQTLIREATAHWGETTQGMQVLTDARAEVKIGELKVVPQSAP